MNQTLPKDNSRAHQAIKKTHNREITIPPNIILVYNVVLAGDGNGIGFVGIKDAKLTYEFFDKVFFKESDIKITKDVVLGDSPSDYVYGYIDVNKVADSPSKLQSTKPKKVISLAEKKRRDFLNGLSVDEMDSYRTYYKIRVMKMERDQGTTFLESVLLDQVEYMKSKVGRKFNLKNFIKGQSKKYRFRYEKLYSGYQKRMVCKRWAKKDFIENDRKFKDLSLPLYKGLIL